MHPVLFTIPIIDLPIYSYGVMLGSSIVFGWFLIMYFGAKTGLPKDKMTNTFILAAIFAMLGSRILYIVTNLHEYKNSGILDFLNVRKGGLVAYGGFIGGFIGSWIYLFNVKIRLLAWADEVVPALASGLGITRIGCFLYGCDYGKPISNGAPDFIKSIGVKFPNWNAQPNWNTQIEASENITSPMHGSPAFLHHVHDGLISSSSEFSALVYPTQLLEIANGWIIFAFLLFYRSKIKFRGQLFLIFTAYYGVTRSLMECIRGDTGRGGFWIFSTSQAIGIITFFIAIVMWAILSKKAKQNPEAAMSLILVESPK